MRDREIPFAPEGQCPICGGYIFTKEERKEQVKLAREIVDKLKREKAERELPKCYQKVLNGEKGCEVDFCYSKPECHFCNDPYTCVIPHYLMHLLGKEHKDDEI